MMDWKSCKSLNGGNEQLEPRFQLELRWCCHIPHILKEETCLICCSPLKRAQPMYLGISGGNKWHPQSWANICPFSTLEMCHSFSLSICDICLPLMGTHLIQKSNHCIHIVAIGRPLIYLTKCPCNTGNDLDPAGYFRIMDRGITIFHFCFIFALTR